MTQRKPKRRKIDPEALRLSCDCCACDARCRHARCANLCLGGHANYPHSHWCAEGHWWKTSDAVTGATKIR